MWGVEEASIKLWGEETTHSHQVSPPDHSLMCGHPHCPQISDLTPHCSILQCCIAVWSTACRCSYLTAIISICIMLLFIKIIHFPNWKFSFMYMGRGSCETKTLFNLRPMSGKWMWKRKTELDWGRIPWRLSRLQCPASDDPFTSWNNFQTSNKLCFSFVFYALVLILAAICMLWWKASF